MVSGSSEYSAVAGAPKVVGEVERTARLGERGKVMYLVP